MTKHYYDTVTSVEISVFNKKRREWAMDLVFLPLKKDFFLIYQFEKEEEQENAHFN